MTFDFLKKYKEKFALIFSKGERKLRNFFADNGFQCDGCGKELFDYPVHRFCAECEEKMGYNDGRTCPKCGRKTVAEGVCLSCKSRLPKFTVGLSPFVYRGETASFINRMKNGAPVLAAYFGERMADCFLEKFAQHSAVAGGEGILVVPIPLTKEREKTRGYNQAVELAEFFCRRLKEKGVEATLDVELLEKRRETAQQKHMNYRERQENVSGAYHVHKRSACRGRTIVLIDDIMTTGATGSECAARLLGAEAKEVIFMVGASLPELK